MLSFCGKDKYRILRILNATQKHTSHSRDVTILLKEISLRPGFAIKKQVGLFAYCSRHHTIKWYTMYNMHEKVALKLLMGDTVSHTFWKMDMHHAAKQVVFSFWKVTFMLLMFGKALHLLCYFGNNKPPNCQPCQYQIRIY